MGLYAFNIFTVKASWGGGGAVSGARQFQFHTPSIDKMTIIIMVGYIIASPPFPFVH